ncbi:peptidoglycan DD-metalloendopeptidase family protein [Streptomyces sp. NPDC008141]|uniref:M23 family metallopeptidase n=1 Tax=Streptomyces sp. NPDC008141 TaxID=3364815 RepID=UPI0036EC2D53
MCLRPRDRLLLVPVVLCALLATTPSPAAGTPVDPMPLPTVPVPAVPAPLLPGPLLPGPLLPAPLLPAPVLPGPPAPALVAPADPEPPVPPAAAPEPAAPPVDGPDISISAEVARLYAEAARATAGYEKGRRAAEAQRLAAGRLQDQLDQQRGEMSLLRDDLGGVARAQYRNGGSLTFTARLLLSKTPDELLRGRRIARQAEEAVGRLLDRARLAEQRLSTAERRARAVWHDLDVRRAGLAAAKQRIATKLEAAQWTLQGEADRSVAAGTCAGAVPVDEDTPPAAAWVPPVEDYALSASFGSGGSHWVSGHTGQDFAVGIGAPVRAVGAGRVLSVSCGGAFGIEIIVQHPGGYYTQYAHLASLAVDQGQQVRTGQWIGQAGTTGNSTGPHLHFEVRLTPHLGSGVDPVPWLAERGVGL